METGNRKTMTALTFYIGLSLILLLDHSVFVLSCSSKPAATKPPIIYSHPPSPSTTQSPTTEKFLPPISDSEGVWKTEGDRSSYLSSRQHQQEESLSASPVNGHNEGLLLKTLPTQDTGINDRQGGSASDDDETSSSVISSNNNQKHHHNKNIKPLELVHFSNKSIKCNDKSTAGYYIRKSPLKGSNIWIVFLEGGWYCFDERSCQNRWLRLKNLMTSSSWSHYKHVGGILSSDPSENPYWWSANHVFVPYCSSDSWSGTESGESGSQFSFMGALIVDEVVKNLIKKEGLRADSTVILAGSSAGGTGVLINLDRVEYLLNEEFGNAEAGPPRVRVRGIADSGWFIDKLPSFSEKVDCHDVILCPPEISLKKGMTLWNARLPESCQASYPDAPWSCFFGYRIYPTLKASLFVFQWLFDEAQMLVNNVPTPALRKEEWDYVYKVGDELKKTLINVTNVFIPACLAHTVLTHRDWKRVEVNSVYLPRALKCWESGGIIEESNFIPSRSSHKYWENEQESSLSNVNRKHTRTGNRISSSASNPSTSSAGVLEQSDLQEVVSSNDSSRRNRRRHNRHRQSNNKRERRKRRKQEILLKALEDKRRNLPIDFNPSNLEAPEGRQKKRHNNDRIQEQFNRKNNKNLRPSISRSNIDNSDVTISSNHIRNRNKKKHRRRRWFSVCDAAESGVSSGGDIRLIEKCSWPQCNKSCPKLLNPLTGEEVDFKDLLKSFGLDMGTMAKALGIDLATLNSMDHQVLLQMLTQHA